MSELLPLDVIGAAHNGGQDDARPKIELRASELPAARRELIEAWKKDPNGFFLNDVRIVRVEVATRDALGGGTTEALELRAVALPEFLIACDAVARLMRVKATKTGITLAP